MPDGKPAGTPCIQLDETYRCKIFGQPARPDFCAGLQPSVEMCGNCREDALTWLAKLEADTKP